MMMMTMMKITLHGISSFHFYRWNQFKVIPSFPWPVCHVFVYIFPHAKIRLIRCYKQHIALTLQFSSAKSKQRR